jgi:hypothetical protein
MPKNVSKKSAALSALYESPLNLSNEATDSSMYASKINLMGQFQKMDFFSYSYFLTYF